MRLIGQLQDEQAALTLGDYLYVHGIDNQVDHEAGYGWGIWINEEDKLEEAAKLFQEFQQNPADPKDKSKARAAAGKRSEEEKANEAYRKKFVDRRQIFRSVRVGGLGPVTLTLMIISIGVFALSLAGLEFQPIRRLLYISEGTTPGMLPEVMSGQLWRLITPIFLHMSPLHILFNMLWLFDLGRLVERRQGSRFLLLLVAGVAVVSNVAQYVLSGPAFGGMSGVVYGLLGYVWLRGKLDFASGYFVHPTTMMFMLVWLGLGYVGFMNMANGAHTVGLLAGAGWAYVASRR